MGRNDHYMPPGMAASMGLSLPAAPAASASEPPSPPPAPIGGLDFSALMGAMGGGAPAPAAVPSTAASSATGAPADDAQAALRAAMSAAMGAVPAVPAAASTAAALPASSQRPIRLEDTVTAERVLESGILSDPEVRAALVAMLPAGQDDDAALEANLRSPQLRQAMGTLTAALHSDNYNSVFANLGVDPQVKSPVDLWTYGPLPSHHCHYLSFPYTTTSTTHTTTATTGRGRSSHARRRGARVP